MIKRIVTAEQLDNLPSELHKIVAQILIQKGEWVVENTTTSSDCRMVSA